MIRTDAHLVHIPKTGGTSIATAFGLKDTHRPAYRRRAEDPDRWDHSFTFAIVRNPWDHAVSLWFHSGKWKEVPFVAWVRAGCPWTPIQKHDASDQWGYISDEHRRPLVNAVYDFAQLPAVFTDLCCTIGSPLEDLPHIHEENHDDAGGRKPYTHYYEGDEEVIQHVGKRNIELVKRMGYRFDRADDSCLYVPVRVDLSRTQEAPWMIRNAKAKTAPSSPRPPRL